MSNKKTKFNELWLDKSLFPQFESWVVKVEDNPYLAQCKICCKKIDLSNMGQRALTSHSTSKSHQSFVQARKSSNLKSFLSRKKSNTIPTSPSEPKVVEELSTDCSTLNSGRYFFNKNEVITSEIKWCLYVVFSRMSMNSCSNVSELFYSMFPDSQIAKNFALGKTKCTYIINFGISKYFFEALIDDVNLCTDFVICFDEAMNKISQTGQMDLVVRYFNSNTNLVETRYLNSEFMGSAKADDLLRHFEKGIAFLRRKNLLQVSMDGPNVNLSFFKKLKEYQLVLDPDGKKLLDIGVCGLHVVHGAVKSGLQKVEWNLSLFLRDIYYLFNDSPARRSLFTNITGTKVFPLKYCGIRCLENSICIERALNLIDDLKKFLNDPNVKLPNTKRVENLKLHIKDEMLKCKLSFFKNICKDCEGFLRKYQSAKPLVPYLYEDMTNIVRNFVKRIVKKKILESFSKSLLSIDLSDNANLLDIEFIDIGFLAAKILKTTKNYKKFESKFKLDCRTIIISIINKISERSPLKYPLVLYLSSLAPSNIFQNRTLFISRFHKLLQCLYENNRISDSVAENSLEQYESFCNAAQTIFKTDFENFIHKELNNECRLDEFYFKLIGEDSKYVQLTAVMKICLILSHGNSSVVSGFSINKTLLVENQLEESLVAQRRVIDGINKSGGVVNNVEITPKLKSMVRTSHSNYVNYLDQKKKISEEENESLKLKRKNAHVIKNLLEEKKKIRIDLQMAEDRIDNKLRSLNQKDGLRLQQHFT